MYLLKKPIFVHRCLTGYCVKQFYEKTGVNILKTILSSSKEYAKDMD